jgi:predicted GTPase
MISRRSAIIAALLLIPVLVYAAAGGYALWQEGLLRRLWWVAPVLWAIAWGLARLWRVGHKTAPPAEEPAPSRWTPRDEQAAEIVRRFQRKVDELSPHELAELATYRTEAQALALELARHYHSAAEDAWSSVRVTDLLAALRLAIDDLEPWVAGSLPGSHLLTMQQGLKLQSVPKWLRRIQNTWWAASVLWNPANLLGGLVMRITGDSLMGAVQTEFLASFYSRFIQRVGFYLIEMNSGRLRGGADAYRRAFPEESRTSSSLLPSPPLGGRRSPVPSPQSPSSGEGGAPRAPPQTVSIALVGQVSSGKSSLINALKGSHEAAVDILPETKSVERYQLSIGDPPVAVTLLDTPGYGEAGATAEQTQQIRSALRLASGVLLVMDAHSPAREADRRTLDELQKWYASQADLKPPPVVGVLTHVDLLRPTLEWSPPYEWRQPAQAKAESIHEAVGYARELFDGALVEVAPACTDARSGRAWGLLEEVIPAITLMLSEAQSVALLRAFERELQQDRFTTLLRQIQRCGSSVLQCWIAERLSQA